MKNYKNVGAIVRESEKAIAVEDQNGLTWFPKSQCIIIDNEGSYNYTVFASAWICGRNNWNEYSELHTEEQVREYALEMGMVIRGEEKEIVEVVEEIEESTTIEDSDKNEYVKMAKELLSKNSFAKVDSKVKELLLKAYEVLNLKVWDDITKDIVWDHNYDVWKLVSGSTDFQRYILS